MHESDFSALNPAPYADHQGFWHAINLAGQHRGNRFCVTCQVPVGMPDFDEAQASASVPVVAVVTFPDTLAVRDRLIMRAYLTKATTGMNLTRAFVPTVRGFNEAYGARCRNWAQVAQVAHYLLEGK